MFSLSALGMVALDMVGTLKILGLVAGVLLIVIWLVSVKNTVGLFYEKKKIRATVFFGIPGIILLVMGIVLQVTSSPITTNFYVANYDDREGKLEIDGKSYTLGSGSYEKIEIRTKADSFAVKGWVGDSAVFDTMMSHGSYIGSLGGNKVVVAEEVEYSASSFSSGSDDLGYEILMSPGIARFSTDLEDDLYGFDEEAPQTMSVSSYSTTVRKWDLQLLSQEALFQQFLDALGEGGDSLGLDDLGLDSLGGDSIEMEE